MPRSAKIYAYLVVAAGVVSVLTALWHSEPIEPVGFAVYLALTLGASVLKVRLPGVTAMYSTAALFLLFGVAYLGPAETMLAGCASAILQSFWKAEKRPTALQVLFNAASVAVSIGACLLLAVVFFGRNASRPDVLVLFAAVYFIVNALVVARILSLLLKKPLTEVAEQSSLEWFTYYVAGAALIGLLPIGQHHSTLESWLILPPLIYLAHFYSGLALHKADPGSSPDSTGTDGIPRAARLFIAAMVSAGAALLIWSLVNWHSDDLSRFLAYAAATAMLATWKVRLPQMEGTISLYYVVLLVAIAELQPGEIFLIAALGAAVQSLWSPKSAPKLFQIAFNMSALIVASGLSYATVRLLLAPFLGESVAMLLSVSTTLFYAVDSLILVVVLSLIESQPLARVWRNCHFWSFPYFIVGTVGSGLMVSIGRTLGWGASLLTLPILGLVYVTYRWHLRNAVAVTPEA